MTRQRIYSLILAFFSVTLALFLCETGLRFLSFHPKYYYVWPPYFHSTLKPLSDITPGIKGESRFIVNSKGVRGDELPSDSRYKILALGGSSTECTFLDQAEAWPFLLQKRLTQAAGGRVWVGNAGKSGNTTRQHILQMKYLLPQFPDIEAVIILPGINDLTTMLSRDKRHNLNKDEPEEELLMLAFSLIPLSRKSDLPFYKNTALWQACKKIRYLIFSAGEGQDIYARQYITWRRHRENAKTIINVLPDMSQALEEYSRNINAMIDIGRQKGARLIFLTQPVLWKPGLSKDLQGLLWLGGVGNFQKEEGKEYYSVDALAEGIEVYNRVLLRICKDRRVECIDLASMLPKDATVFYDDCHFNEDGSQKVSEILSQYLLQRKPFSAE